MDNEKDIRTIHIGTDHAGFEMKEDIKKFLQMKDFEVIDHGALEFNEDDDYPDFILPVAVEVSQDEHSLGIILGGSGQGEAMVANRVPGIRATVYYGETGTEEDIITLSKLHNDANILSLGARFLSDDEAKEAVERWLETCFSNEERHARRINKIDNLDNLMVGNENEEGN
jgi:ribose 5-phosphate isomerase B